MNKLLTLTRAKLWIQDDAPEGSGGMYRISNAAFEFEAEEMGNIWLSEIGIFGGNNLISHYGYDSLNDIVLRARKCLQLKQEDIEIIECYKLE